MRSVRQALHACTLTYTYIYLPGPVLITPSATRRCFGRLSKRDVSDIFAELLDRQGCRSVRHAARCSVHQFTPIDSIIPLNPVGRLRRSLAVSGKVRGDDLLRGGPHADLLDDHPGSYSRRPFDTFEAVVVLIRLFRRCSEKESVVYLSLAVREVVRATSI